MYYVYRFLNEEGDVIYVGRSKNIIDRMRTHFGKGGHLSKTAYDHVETVQFITAKTRIDMNILELYYIGKFLPRFNTFNKSVVTLEIDHIAEWINFPLELIDKQMIDNYSEFIDDDSNEEQESVFEEVLDSKQAKGHTSAEHDELWDDVIKFGISRLSLSASLIQRSFSIGYNRAARLMDRLDELGVTSETVGNKPKEFDVESPYVKEWQSKKQSNIILAS